MKESGRSTRIIAFVTLIAVSMMVGLSMPAFYEWTDSDQSRPSPLLWKVPVWSAIAVSLCCCVLPWLPIVTPQEPTRPTSNFRFGLRTLLVLTAVVAIAIPSLAKFPIVAAGIICGLAFANFIRVGVKEPNTRLPATALLACMILPYAWVVRYEELDRIQSHFLWMIATWPTFFPVVYLGGIFGQPFRDSPWLAMLLTAIEVAVGTWFICLGPKRTIAYSQVVLLISAMGSLVFYQLCVF